MAERRMFAKTIVESDSFLDMPASTQCLYFHLGMAADDEGFVNAPRRIQRGIGATEDDLKLLLAKGFLLGFDSGVVVLKHWKVNNYLQSDRVKPTACTDEKRMLRIKENKAYSLTEGEMYTECIQNVYIDKTRLDKTSIDKTSIEEFSIDKTRLDKTRGLWSRLSEEEERLLLDEFDAIGLGDLNKELEQKLQGNYSHIKNIYAYIRGAANKKNIERR